jgi:hypothetical protein
MPYASWAQEPRRRVRARLGELLRVAGDLERLLELEPTDEAVARALMQDALDAGRRHAALRVYEGLRVALARDLAVAPAAETRALYERCTAGIRLGERVFVGRTGELGRRWPRCARLPGRRRPVWSWSGATWAWASPPCAASSHTAHGRPGGGRSRSPRRRRPAPRADRGGGRAAAAARARALAGLPEQTRGRWRRSPPLRARPPPRAR